MNSERVKAHIVNWLIDYAKKAHVQGFVVGVSGGVDSAITSVLGAETGLSLICIEMSINQADDQVTRAKEHVSWLKKKYKNVSNKEVELTSLYSTFLNVISSEEVAENMEITLANVQARLRMTTLYYFAGLNNYLVLGTGNKVEDFGVGFFTKYGDGGVDLSPIADLMKSEVYSLGKHLGIVESILSAAPTDGLWGDERTDEDQLGATYPELEWAMQVSENNEINFQQFTERQKEVFEIFTSFNKKNKHKMLPIPVCIVPEELKC